MHARLMSKCDAAQIALKSVMEQATTFQGDGRLATKHIISIHQWCCHPQHGVATLHVRAGSGNSVVHGARAHIYTVSK